MRRFKLNFTVFFLISFNVLFSTKLNLKIIDRNNTPVSWVIVQSEKQSVVSDSLGYVSLNASEDEKSFTFSRLGFLTTTKTVNQLLNDNIVRISFAPIATDEFVVKTESESVPFRMSSESRRIEIEELNKTYSSVNDIIKDIQYLDIRGIQLTGERQSISLGGHQGRHTVIMLDNIVLNPAGQAVDLASIPASQIESVEIVKNNVSVETGSGGIAGMLILHTKKNTRQNQISFSESVGSFNSIKQNINFQFFHNRFAFTFNTSQLYAKNDFEYEHREEKYRRVHNNKSIINFTSDIQYQYRQTKLIYNHRYQKFFKQLPGPVNYENLYKMAFQQGSTTHHNLLYSDKFNLFSSLMNFDTQVYLIQNESIYDNTQAPIRIYYAIDENIQEIKGVKTGVKQEFNTNIVDFSFNLGCELKEESFKTKDLIRNEYSLEKITQKTNSVFASQGIKKDLYYWIPEIITSLRIDDSNKFDTYKSWRAEFNNYFYSFIPFQVKSNLGTSYMIPSFYDLYWKGDSQTNGNQNLKPEESFGWRVEGFVDSNPSLGIAKWNNKTDNLIFWYRSLHGWRPDNLQSAEIDNWEFFSDYNFLKNQSLKLNYTRTIAKEKSKNPDGTNGDFYDKYIIYTPAWKWNVQLNLRAGIFSQSFTYIAQGKQWSTRDQLIPALKNYEIFNTKSAVDFSFGILKSNLNLFIYNLFDKKYENYPYVPEPGRHWEVQINFKLI